MDELCILKDVLGSVICVHAMLQYLVLFKNTVSSGWCKSPVNNVTSS